jgi:hypothetical protein
VNLTYFTVVYSSVYNLATRRVWMDLQNREEGSRSKNLPQNVENGMEETYLLWQNSNHKRKI